MKLTGLNSITFPKRCTCGIVEEVVGREEETRIFNKFRVDSKGNKQTNMLPVNDSHFQNKTKEKSHLVFLCHFFQFLNLSLFVSELILKFIASHSS